MVIENTDYGMAKLRDPNVTYPWNSAYSARCFQFFEMLGRGFIRALLPALAGLGVAFRIGRYQVAGLLFVLAYWLTSAYLMPPGCRGLYETLLFIFSNYPGQADERPQPGRFEMTGPSYSKVSRNCFVMLSVFSTTVAVYSLQTLCPTWPEPQNYWPFITDQKPMSWTAILLSIAFQGFGTLVLARSTFNAAYAKILTDRFHGVEGYEQ